MDNQVKLRGYRIELGEIEAALRQYPGLREAVVIVREDNPGDKRLVAYIVSDHKSPTLNSVREFLGEKLPAYMLPSAVVGQNTLPLTPNGKIDRRALPAPEVCHSNTDKPFVAPQTLQEQALADIWAKVLRLDRVSVQDSLFDLGADSIHVFQITARANAAGLKFTPIQLLEHPKISSLVMALQDQENSKENDDAPIKRVSRVSHRVKVS
jgi:aryl carrier-like protein